MPSEPQGFPTLPPKPDDPGEYLTFFNAHVAKYGFDRNQDLTITLTVPMSDKYRAMPLSDLRGRLFLFEVFNPSKRPLLKAGELAVNDMARRVEERRAERRGE